MTVSTYPYCGSCGNPHEIHNYDQNQRCDNCGADITYSGFAGTATAGSPGSFDGDAPSSLAVLQASGIVASPATAWTTGQSVTLGDASSAHWTGTAWASGAAS